MAHWIIKDRGLEGAFYTCSHCGTIYWDILNKIDHKHCPCCYEPINEDEEEYYMDPTGDWRR